MQQFGGDWTHDKLERVRKYLAAYMQIMKSRPFRVAYIDAFAGTGYVEAKDDPSGQSLFDGIASDEVDSLAAFAEPASKQFIDGSARIALSVEPRSTSTSLWKNIRLDSLS